MNIRRRSLRKILIALGCIVATVDFPAAMIGGLFLLSGAALHLWSKGYLEQNLRLTTAGPYRWTRNPFYLANLSIDVGLCFVIGRGWVAVLFLPVWWFSYRQTISREEARLRTLFSDDFLEYQDFVPRLIPSGRRLPLARAAGRFSWKNDSLLRGSEYARLMGIGLAPGTVWAAEVLRRERMMVFEEANRLPLEIIMALLCAWVVKLALAETFRRPETALLPFGTQSIYRFGVMSVLIAGAAWIGNLWAGYLAGLWGMLWGLDRLGRSRLAQAGHEKRRLWKYFASIAIASLVTFAGVVLLVRSANG